MARIRITLPDVFVFSTELPVYVTHINVGGHLDNVDLLTLVSEARDRYYRFLGFRENNVEGFTTIITDAAVEYRSEGRPGDVMVVEMAFCNPNKYGGDLVWRMSAMAPEREIARGKTGFVFLDRESRKVVKAPKSFLRKTLPQDALVHLRVDDAGTLG